MKKIWTILVVIGFGLSSLFQILILFRVYTKGGGTTGADPVTPIAPFAILAGLAAFVAVWQSANVQKAWYVLALISGIFGSILPFWLEFTGTLVQYDRALMHKARVLDEEHGFFSLCVFSFVQAAVLAFGWYASRRVGPIRT